MVNVHHKRFYYESNRSIYSSVAICRDFIVKKVDLLHGSRSTEIVNKLSLSYLTEYSKD
uniref:Uncharacterized protein n=1 Tax=Virgibacillus oceani TaxID=1479511 RepID=A0A917LXM8_9BACI|nr:hypothetical protein GCM10011398_05140 [Virgibacillus oceani]